MVPADPPARDSLLRSSPLSTVVALLLLTVGTAVATHSVVRYRVWIIVIYTVLCALLAAWAVSGSRRRASAPAARARPGSPVVWIGGALSTTLVLIAVVHLTMRPWTYVTSDQGWLVRALYAAAALVLAAGIAVSTAQRKVLAAHVALGVTAVLYVVAGALLIHWDPSPKIDVWVTLQQAADGLLEGKNMYSQQWSDSPGVQDAFTYLPFTGLLLAPGRWLAGDVRWALLVVTLLGALAVMRLGRSGASTQPGRMSVRNLVGPGAAGLLLVLPGTATQVEQAWTEPLLMACLAGWALAVRRRRMVLAMICLALGLASKQHLAVLLPVLAVWPVFGWRRAVGTAGLAGVFMLPWFIASPADMIHDTVTMLINFQPLVFANTWFIAAINELDWTPPFYLTGAVVLIALGTAVVRVHRQQPDLANVLRWAAVVLFAANLVNKQAFYNQYWLVAALVIISFAAARYPAPDGETTDESETPAVTPAETGPGSAETGPGSAETGPGSAETGPGSSETARA
ncbi:glycosyltransferase family 87 protein [Kineosporia succinea]|uniref:DUF2029 domain-containing protein n=1 Tax=Kineosporia succinea TaxID=84632 RepID=A0ABT9P6Q3_9ACTN|nr:glycosyltransferase family 87 protein [Kineosporia succinea]MDP9828241.1 hypothetical protein [Kineosporia succinea]